MDLTIQLKNLTPLVVREAEACGIKSIYYKNVWVNLKKVQQCPEAFSVALLNQSITIHVKPAATISEEDKLFYNNYIYVNRKLEGKNYLPIKAIGRTERGDEILFVCKGSNQTGRTDTHYLGTNSADMFRCIPNGVTFPVDELGLDVIGE
jgi:hypothetical protein